MTANSANTYSSFDALNQRLDQIVQEVADESLPLDDVLTLYEEAVNLGLRGCDLLEEGIQAYEEQEAVEADGAAEGAQPESGAQPVPQSGEAAADAQPLPQSDEAADQPSGAKPQ